MLSPLDDYPVHQIAEPIRHVAHERSQLLRPLLLQPARLDSDELFLVTGLGQYPNLGVTDAFATMLRTATKQYVVRASRELGNDRLDTSVGPLRDRGDRGPEVAAACSCEPNEWGARVRSHLGRPRAGAPEPRHFVRQLGRVVFDTSRFAQTGCWTGALEIAGEKLTRRRPIASGDARPLLGRASGRRAGASRARRAKLGVPFAFWNYARCSSATTRSSTSCRRSSTARACSSRRRRSGASASTAARSRSAGPTQLRDPRPARAWSSARRSTSRGPTARGSTSACGRSCRCTSVSAPATASTRMAPRHVPGRAQGSGADVRPRETGGSREDVRPGRLGRSVRVRGRDRLRALRESRARRRTRATASRTSWTVRRDGARDVRNPGAHRSDEADRDPRDRLARGARPSACRRRGASS